LCQPNQRLKLTEPAVDDFAARKTKETEMNNGHVRATVYMELAARCRSLAAVRYASLVAGEGYKQNKLPKEWLSQISWHCAKLM